MTRSGLNSQEFSECPFTIQDESPVSVNNSLLLTYKYHCYLTEELLIGCIKIHYFVDMIH